MTTASCTHPDHNDHETCEDRACACSKDCRCCNGPSAEEIDMNERIVRGLRKAWNVVAEDWSDIEPDAEPTINDMIELAADRLYQQDEEASDAFIKMSKKEQDALFDRAFNG